MTDFKMEPLLLSNLLNDFSALAADTAECYFFQFTLLKSKYLKNKFCPRALD